MTLFAEESVTCKYIYETDGKVRSQTLKPRSYSYFHINTARRWQMVHIRPGRSQHWH